MKTLNPYRRWKNFKTKMARLGVFGSVLTTLAFSLVFFVIAIIIVVAAIVGTIWYLAHTLLPPAPPPAHQGNQVEFEIIHQTPPNKVQQFTDTALLGLSNTLGLPFGLQYGVRTTNGPWIQGDLNVQPQIVETLVDTEENYEFLFTVGTNWYRYWLSGNTDHVLILRPPPAPYTNTYSVVIERTDDLQNWQPVMTNLACLNDTVQIFIDSNSPPDRAFYRVDCIATNAP